MQHVRLLAAVLAKNAVGSSWRKTLGTREWSRIPETEKEYVRSAAANLLFTEPQRRVATQTALLIANIARFDFPGRWPTLLSDLTSAGLWDGDAASEATVERNDRALFTLKHVVRAVKSKRIVVETPASSGGSVSTAGKLLTAAASMFWFACSASSTSTCAVARLVQSAISVAYTSVYCTY